jgi:hypothetical protein
MGARPLVGPGPFRDFVTRYAQNFFAAIAPTVRKVNAQQRDFDLSGPRPLSFETFNLS